MTNENFQVHPHGIVTIDSGYIRPQFDACYLMVEGDQAAFIETATSHSVPRLLAALEQNGIEREKVAYVIITHVHLDHAGGAGALLEHLPNAQLVVHPRGARHMIDPTKLIAGSIAVYGEEAFKKLYGTIAPISADRVIEAGDLFTLELNGRSLLFLDTPGHARHHFCVVDEKSRAIFTGDTFGLSYREMDSAQGAFIFPTTTPVHFDPEALHQSVDRIMSYHPEAIYLTHYSQVSNCRKLADDLHHRLERFVSLAHNVLGEGDARHQALVHGIETILLDEAKSHECHLSDKTIVDLLHQDFELNAQGIEVWLDKQASPPK